MAYFWVTSSEEADRWKGKCLGQLKVNREYFFNNANIILSQENELKASLIQNLTGDLNIEKIIRTKDKKSYKGIEIKEFNKSLREKLSENKDLLFEVYNEDGVFYTSKGQHGFDFARLDVEYNTIQLWNLCFGRRALCDGDKHWKKTLKDNKFILDKINLLEDTVESFKKGENQYIDKKLLTILGELQFGNWGLVYRDLFKLLHADINSGVDLFVYVTADADLLNYASDGIVSYEKTVNILNEFSSLIKVPVWVIGLDIDIV